MSDDAFHHPFPPPPPPDPASASDAASAGAGAGSEGDAPADPKPTRARPGQWRPSGGFQRMVDGVLDSVDAAADRVAEVTRARELIEQDRKEREAKPE